MKKCIICNGTPYNRRSNFCTSCFEKMLIEKVKEEDKKALPVVKSL